VRHSRIHPSIVERARRARHTQWPGGSCRWVGTNRPVSGRDGHDVPGQRITRSRSPPRRRRRQPRRPRHPRRRPRTTFWNSGVTKYGLSSIFFEKGWPIWLDTSLSEDYIG
jgi:hypothetical protein